MWAPWYVCSLSRNNDNNNCIKLKKKSSWFEPTTQHHPSLMWWNQLRWTKKQPQAPLLAFFFFSFWTFSYINLSSKMFHSIARSKDTVVLQACTSKPRILAPHTQILCWDSTLLCSPGQPRTHSVGQVPQADLQLTILMLHAESLHCKAWIEPWFRLPLSFPAAYQV